MVQVGHALLGSHGKVLSLDDGFCEILGTTADTIVGRSVLDVTVPADRGTCATLMRNLAATREPFRVTKRYIRGDGGEVWVTNTVSVIELGDAPPMLVSTIIPIDPPVEETEPAAMLDCARFLLSVRRDRASTFGPIFAEPAWDMMLTAYIADAEGRSLGLGALSRAASLPDDGADRWARALVQEGLLEVEPGGRADDGIQYRITAATHRQVEEFLSGVIHKRLPASTAA